MPIRTWLDMHWMVHTGLSGRGTSTAECYAWHQDAVGHGIKDEIQTQWDWNQPTFAWDGATALGMGACVIDVNGLVQIRVDDTAALPS